MKTSEIAEFVGGVLYGDGGVEIVSAASIENAKEGQITFLEKSAEMPLTHSSCVIVPDSFEMPKIESPAAERFTGSVIRVKHPKLAFARIAGKIHARRMASSGIHSTASIADPATIQANYVGAFVSVGENSRIGEGSVIFDGVRIGNNVTVGNSTVVHPNCVIYDNVNIGNNCTIHAGTVIGADGFGYVKNELGNYEKFPQIGTVTIEDNVEIGANSCIDRGALGETRIGEGTKIDNLVQVGHNVSIGKRCVIAAQTGISGSVAIEDDCVIGGQVGFGDHVRVKSGAVIGSQAGVLPGKIVRPGVWWGTPIQPLDSLKKQNAHVRGIERLKKDVNDLKRAAGGTMKERDS